MPPKPAAGYYRVSVARDDMKAPELYEGEIRRYCSYRGLELGPIFSDIDRSGYRNSEKRPALNELVRRRHEFSAVVIPKLSRLGREVKHLTQLFAVFDSDGIPLIFLDLTIDPSTSDGRLLRNVMAAFAEHDSDVRGDYTRANRRRIISEGRPFAGKPPFGYVYVRETKSYAPDPERAHVVRFIFARYFEGVTQIAIAKELHDKQWRTLTGKTWQPNKIGRLLDNPAYAALQRLDGEFVEANWEPLVEREAWDAIVERRRATRLRWSHARKPKSLLAGLIFCGDCGRKAYFMERGGKYPARYQCSRADVSKRCSAGGVNARRAEQQVTAAFLERASYYLVERDGRSFIAQQQWDDSESPERRMLLRAVIDKVEILPRPEGERHPGAGGRRLRIDWKAAPTPVESPDFNRRTQSTTRGAAFHREQLAEARAEEAAAKQTRAERSRAVAASWRQVREERLIDAGIPAAVGRPVGAAISAE